METYIEPQKPTDEDEGKMDDGAARARETQKPREREGHGGS